MSKPKLYIDSCCLIHAISFSLGKNQKSSSLSKEDYEKWLSQQILRAAFKQQIEIVGSTFLLAEVRRGHGQDKAPIEIKEKIRNLFRSGQVIKLADVTSSIAEKARDFEWVDGIPIRPADSIHMATAITLKCEEFITLDGSSGGRGKILSAAAHFKKYGIDVIRPSQSIHLPPSFRNPTLFETQ